MTSYEYTLLLNSSFNINVIKNMHIEELVTFLNLKMSFRCRFIHCSSIKHFVCLMIRYLSFPKIYIYYSLRKFELVIKNFNTDRKYH